MPTLSRVALYDVSYPLPAMASSVANHETHSARSPTLNIISISHTSRLITKTFEYIYFIVRGFPGVQLALNEGSEDF